MCGVMVWMWAAWATTGVVPMGDGGQAEGNGECQQVG